MDREIQVEMHTAFLNTQAIGQRYLLPSVGAKHIVASVSDVQTPRKYKKRMVW